MVNFGLNPASILGLFLAVAGAALFYLRSIRPELSRDHDIFFAAIGLLSGCILLFQGWRLDPILLLGQFLLSGSAIFFAVESIRLRGVATEQARRNTPTVDRERPVSRTRVYREEEYDRDRDRIEDSYGYEGAKPNYDSPRLRGYDDPESRARNPRRRTSSSKYIEPDNYPPRRRKSSSARSDRYKPERQDDWETPEYPPRSEYQGDRYSDEPPRSTPRRNTPDASNLGRSYKEDNRGRNYDSGRSRDFDKPRDYGAGMGRSYDEGIGRSYQDDEDVDDVVTTDYVDYQPMNDSDYPDDERDWDRERPSKEDEQSDWEEKPRRNRPQNDEY